MRTWTNTPAGAADDGSIHALGNGQLCAYEQGPNLVQVFGPPYSSPSLYQLNLDMPAAITVTSQREPDTAMWTHRITAGGRALGEIIDFVDAELPCLIRQVRATEPLRFHLAATPPLKQVDNSSHWRDLGAAGGWLFEAPAGRYLYHTYPFPAPIYHQIAWRGPVAAAFNPEALTGELICGPGECELFCACGPDYPRALTHAETALRTPPGELAERTRRWWHGFTQARTDFNTQLPNDLPRREQLLQAIDDVAVLIKCQQSAEGAVLAGHNYHMGYVRDQYGVSRGLLALGHVAEARRILGFYWDVWQRYGRIHNAQAAGVDGVFHVHENDQVEITGYLIRQAFDLQQASRDALYGDAFVAGILPMLEWAWEAQKQHLVDGMLPFNGDETYVAGGILPRHTLNDGSAEATMLFLDGGARLLSWVERKGCWSAEKLARDRAVLDATKASFRANFWQDGRLITNNPRRAAMAQLPRFRHGVCERCQSEGRYHGIVWTERNATNRYLCPECLARGEFPAAPATAYVLQSVSLTPFYFQSDLFTSADLQPVLDAIVQRHAATGKLPSRPDDEDANIAVGYDYGLLLYALAELHSPAAATFYDQTLSLLDPTGAWVEYYIDHHPMGTRCRPWESAINLEALLRWAMQ